jgi:hypothetical protein
MDHFKYSKIRQNIIEDLKSELMGPSEEDEFLIENPAQTYIVGVLHPDGRKESLSDNAYEEAGRLDEGVVEEIDGKEYEPVKIVTEEAQNKEESVKETVDEEDTFKLSGNIKLFQSSIGMNFFVKKETLTVESISSWGKYEKAKKKLEVTDKNGNGTEKELSGFKREPIEVRTVLDISKKNGRVKLKDGVEIEFVKRDLLKSEFSIISLFLINRKPDSNDQHKWENNLYQAKLEVTGEFWSEYEAKHKHKEDDHFFKDKGVFGRGYGCAVTWILNGDKAGKISTEFMPEQEIPSINPEIDGVNLSMKEFGNAKDREILDRLEALIIKYSEWIGKLESKSNLDSKTFKRNRENCLKTLNRLKKGLELLKNNKNAWLSFKYMNKFMFQQYCMKVYSKKRTEDSELKFNDTEDNEKGFEWRPFQLAFIMINLEGIINPNSEEREIVDLLWFPTGGGKTEAYLGLLAFTMVYRRLLKSSGDIMERDGGVTAILRYTLRLLTTQQRDRLLKMICAAERVRQMFEIKYRKKNKVPPLGYSRFSVGFWVGGSTTPNKLKELQDPETSKDALNNCMKQILNCPFCGEALDRKNYELTDNGLEIRCSHKQCHYSKYSIPVYMIDEEIYAKTPTVIMSTVDKFAALPWKEETALLFGKTNGKDRKNNYINIGNKIAIKETTKEFYPPELIIQDELHLITGPLGTIYGGYETAIEELCSYEENGKKIKPKYIASTATIVNAEAQIKNLYARKETLTFPPQGIEVGDSFFAKEVPVKEKPFRKYLGISAPGQSMKTTLLRVYAGLLQLSEKYNTEELLDVVDPYRTLIGYFNSVRELGGAVMLLKDDIPDRMDLLAKKMGKPWGRSYRTEELTSRIFSNRIPQILERLENTSRDKDFLDVTVATNMIAVGMDVDRLGLMVVAGQPKTTSEYIQATSRIGRKYPGLAICVYNPYRPRDISHFENFIPYHSALYRYVEGTTATPFSARARDRVLKAAIIALVRLGNEEMSQSRDTANILRINSKVLEIRQILEERVRVVQPDNAEETLHEFDIYIDQWKAEAHSDKKLYLYWPAAKENGGESLMTDYGKEHQGKWPILRSMRDVAQSVHLNYYTRGDEYDEN